MDCFFDINKCFIQLKNKYLLNISFLFKIIICFIFIDIYIFEYIKASKKVGVISLHYHKNIGNNLVKYAIYIALSELGYRPYIVGIYDTKTNITFLENNVQMRIIKNFSDIKEQDYDILLVNSDQTWRKWDNNFYNNAFLKFAENWTIKKFIYGASTGSNVWKFQKRDELVAKHLLKNFTGISVRDIGLVKLIKKHLGLKASFVLDPTLLIDKEYYLKIIKNYKNDFKKWNYIFIYKVCDHLQLDKLQIIATIKLNYKIFHVDMNENESIKKFIFGIYHSKAVITNSFHGTIFSIIFNKPFISFKTKDDGRLDTLKQIFKFKDRILNYGEKPNYLLLKKPLNFNRDLLYFLKMKSLLYLKKQLRI